MSERDLRRVNGASGSAHFHAVYLPPVGSGGADLPDGARELSACWRVGIRDIRHGAVSRAFRPLTPGPACRRRARRHDHAAGRARRGAEREFLRDAVRPPAAAPAPVRAAAGEPLRRPEPGRPLLRRASGERVLRRRRWPRRLLRAAVRRALFPDPAQRQCEPGAAVQRVLPGGPDAGVQRQPDRPRLCGRRPALRRPGERVRLSPEDRRGLQLQRQGLVRPRAHRRGVRPDAAAGRHRGERRQRQGGADRDACRQGTRPGRKAAANARRCAARAPRHPPRCRPPRSRPPRRPRRRCRPRRPTIFRKTDPISIESARRPPRRSTAPR